MLAHQVKSFQAIQENSIDIRDHYEYRKIMQSSKNSISKISDSSQPSIKELIELSNRQAGKQASKHSSEAK